MRELKAVPKQNKCSNCVFCQHKDNVELFPQPREKYGVELYCYFFEDMPILLEAPRNTVCGEYTPNTDENFANLVENLTEHYLDMGYETELDGDGNLVFKGTEWIVEPAKEQK